MKGKSVGHGEKTKYFLDTGKNHSWEEVTKAAFDDAFPDKPMALAGQCSLLGWMKPVVSDALAVHPDQIGEAMAHDKKVGISPEYLPDGRPVFKSEAQMRAAMESLKAHRNNCFY